MGTIPAVLEIVPQSIMSIATRRASAAVLSSEPVTHSRANSRPLTANGLPSRRLILARHFPRLISNALMTNCRYSIPHPQARHVYAIRRKGQQRGATVMSSWREIPSLRQAEHALRDSTICSTTTAPAMSPPWAASSKDFSDLLFNRTIDSLVSDTFTSSPNSGFRERGMLGAVDLIDWADEGDLERAAVRILPVVGQFISNPGLTRIILGDDLSERLRAFVEGRDLTVETLRKLRSDLILANVSPSAESVDIPSAGFNAKHHSLGHIAQPETCGSTSMNVLVFASRKGGSGKSTLAAHLAAHVHKQSRPVPH